MTQFGSLLTAVVCVRLLLFLPPAHAAETDPARKIASRVLADTQAGELTPCVVLLADQADLSAAYTMHDADARGWYVYNTLRQHAKRSQRALRAMLRARGISHRALWAANAVVVVAGDSALVNELAARRDVRAIEANRRVRALEDPPSDSPPSTFSGAGAAQRIAWGVSNVNAPQVWAMGYTGQGIVIGMHDTGVQWEHPALRSHYRGWNGSAADHNYNWHDAIHVSGAVCPASGTAPCDSYGHGTETTAMAVGDDGAGFQIGAAPGAQWIACRSVDEQDEGTPERYTECFEFFMAPTDLNGGRPDPTRRPHIVNLSWFCPPAEGCASNTLLTVVENMEAAGIFVPVAAGNDGPGCDSVQYPPEIYAAAFSVGSYDVRNTLGEFSSRGPVTVDGSNRLKPDIVAPGVDMPVSVPPNRYQFSTGTSLSAPMVAGIVALLWSAHPELARDVAATKAILQSSANPDVTVDPAETCGDTPVTTIPNNVFGYGRADALAAVNAVPSPSVTPTATATATAVAASGDGSCAIAPRNANRALALLLPSVMLPWGWRKRTRREVNHEAHAQGTRYQPQSLE